jgi:hypothetical protein
MLRRVIAYVDSAAAANAAQHARQSAGVKIIATDSVVASAGRPSKLPETMQKTTAKGTARPIG